MMHLDQPQKNIALDTDVRPVVLGAHRFVFPVCLAPMAGFTDSTYRCLCREYGADIVVTEMVSAKGLTFDNAHTWELLETDAQERPVAVQLFGHEPARVGEAAARVYARMGDALLSIDLNMGCPAPKIVNNGDGSALMRDLPLAARVISAAVKASPAPVTVKFRKGWDETQVNCTAFGKMCEDSGAAALAVHPRSRSAMYAGRADWEQLARVRAAVKIPVIGNGDVQSVQDALDMRLQTGVDGVMIGRGALGNPFLFMQLRQALSGQAVSPVSPEQRRALALRHAELAFAREGEHALIELRKHLPWYVRGTAGAARLRVRLNACASLDELREILT